MYALSGHLSTPLAFFLFMHYISNMNKTEAIKRAGSIRKLATLFGLTTQAIYSWPEQIPPLRVYQLRELRPQWFKGKK